MDPQSIIFGLRVPLTIWTWGSFLGGGGSDFFCDRSFPHKLFGAAMRPVLQVLGFSSSVSGLRNMTYAASDAVLESESIGDGVKDMKLYGCCLKIAYLLTIQISLDYPDFCLSIQGSRFLTENPDNPTAYSNSLE